MANLFVLAPITWALLALLVILPETSKPPVVIEFDVLAPLVVTEFSVSTSASAAT